MVSLMSSDRLLRCFSNFSLSSKSNEVWKVWGSVILSEILCGPRAHDRRAYVPLSWSPDAPTRTLTSSINCGITHQKLVLSYFRDIPYLFEPRINSSQVILVKSGCFGHFLDSRLQGVFLPLELLHLTPYCIFREALCTKSRQPILNKTNYSTSTR